MSCDVDSDDSKAPSPVKRWIYRLILCAIFLTPIILWPKAVGAALAALVILVAILWFGIKWKFRKFFEKMGESLEEMVSRYGVYAEIPNDLELEPATDVKWLHVRAIIEQREALLARGFELAPAYRVRDVDDIHIQTMIHPTENLWAFFLDHEKGYNLDIAGRKNDGTYFASCNGGGRAPDGDAAAPLFHVLEGEGVVALDDDARALVAVGDRQPISADSVEEDIKAYIRNKRVWLFGDHEAEEQRDQALKVRFLETSGWTALEWDRNQSRVFFIHDEMDRDTCVYRYMGTRVFPDTDDDDDKYEAAYEEEAQRVMAVLAELSPRAGFRRLLEEGHFQERCTHVMALDEPLPADVYLGQVQD